MTKTIIPKCLFLFTSAFIFILFGCKKNESLTAAGITITSVSPVSGKYGITDTIRGKGFSNELNDIQVFFGGVEAVVQNVTDSVILVTVSKNSASGYTTVIRGNQKINGPSFEYINTVSVSTLAGKGFPGYSNGNTDEALFNFPRGLAMDSQGNIFVADFGNYCIRKISPDGKVSTIAGNRQKAYRDGPASNASFLTLNGLAIDAQDNLYIADATRIRKWQRNINVITTIAGNENSGTINGTGINATFSLPYSLAADGQGNIFVTDAINNNIRKISYAGVVTTLAGNTQGYADGTGMQALFNYPGALAFDTAKIIMYLADAGNFRVRLLNAAGDVHTYAGNGNYGYLDGRFFNAEFKFPTGLAVDKKGNVYVCGEENAIRKITPQGDVSTIAGTDNSGFTDGSGEQALFNQPIYLLSAPDGTLYVSDHSNHCIRKIVIE